LTTDPKNKGSNTAIAAWQWEKIVLLAFEVFPIINFTFKNEAFDFLCVLCTISLKRGQQWQHTGRGLNYWGQCYKTFFVCNL
jgi:hypothetical protein